MIRVVLFFVFCSLTFFTEAHASPKKLTPAEVQSRRLKLENDLLDYMSSVAPDWIATAKIVSESPDAQKILSDRNAIQQGFRNSLVTLNSDVFEATYSEISNFDVNQRSERLVQIAEELVDLEDEIAQKEKFLRENKLSSAYRSNQEQIKFLKEKRKDLQDDLYEETLKLGTYLDHLYLTKNQAKEYYRNTKADLIRNLKFNLILIMAAYTASTALQDIDPETRIWATLLVGLSLIAKGIPEEFSINAIEKASLDKSKLDHEKNEIAKNYMKPRIAQLLSNLVVRVEQNGGVEKASKVITTLNIELYRTACPRIERTRIDITLPSKTTKPKSDQAHEKLRIADTPTTSNSDRLRIAPLREDVEPDEVEEVEDTVKALKRMRIPYSE